MSDSAHTPGRWTSSREDMDSYAQNPETGEFEHVVYVYRGEQPRIAVFAGPLDNARADASLISAAPDLHCMWTAQAAALRTLNTILNPGLSDDIDSILGAARDAMAERDRYRTALEKVAKWFGEFPMVDSRFRDGARATYSAEFGSNGERDFMRAIAREALTEREGNQP